MTADERRAYAKKKAQTNLQAHVEKIQINFRTASSIGSTNDEKGVSRRGSPKRDRSASPKNRQNSSNNSIATTTAAGEVETGGFDASNSNNNHEEWTDDSQVRTSTMERKGTHRTLGSNRRSATAAKGSLTKSYSEKVPRGGKSKSYKLTTTADANFR